MTTSNLYAMADTWNAIGTTFDGIKLNISDGAGGAPVGAAASRALRLQANGTDIFSIDVAGVLHVVGNALWDTDNTYDIGASGATRPRTLYLGTSIIAGSHFSLVQDAGSLAIQTPGGGNGLYVYDQGFGTSTGYINLSTTGAIIPVARAYSWSQSADVADTADLKLFRNAAGIISLRGTSSTVPGAMNFYTYGASPPSAPSASMGLLYADTSGGKIRLMARFPSGAAVQIAIEP